MRTLAVDFGTKRLGLALSDEGGRLATPFDVLHNASGTAAMQHVLALVKKEAVQRIVVGLPLNMDGTMGNAAKASAAWGKLLADRSGIPVVFVDERLSSFAAEQSLIQRKRAGEKLTRQRKKEQLDALAASGFLQEFLDGKLSPINVE